MYPVPLSHPVVVVVVLRWLSVLSLLLKMICVELCWSVKSECYTILKPCLKHWALQHSQSSVHTLHWCGIIWSFACSASLPPPCAVLLLPYHFVILKWPPNLLYFPKYPKSQCFFFCFDIAPARFVLSCLHSPCIACFTSCVSSFCSLAVFWTPNCSACSLEGELWLTSQSNLFISTFLFATVLLCTPMLRHMKHTCCRHADSLACSPLSHSQCCGQPQREDECPRCLMPSQHL